MSFRKSLYLVASLAALAAPWRLAAAAERIQSSTLKKVQTMSAGDPAVLEKSYENSDRSWWELDPNPEENSIVQGTVKTWRPALDPKANKKGAPNSKTAKVPPGPNPEKKDPKLSSKGSGGSDKKEDPKLKDKSNANPDKGKVQDPPNKDKEPKTNKWLWAGGGAVLGGVVGFLMGGPMGALLGALGGGLLGFLASSLF